MKIPKDSFEAFKESDTGIIPSCVKYINESFNTYVNTHNGIICHTRHVNRYLDVFIELPPSIYTVSIQEGLKGREGRLEPRKFKLAFPYVIIQLQVRNSARKGVFYYTSNACCFFSNGPLELNQELYRAPLPNIYDDVNEICTPMVSSGSFHQLIKEFVDRFLFTTFNEEIWRFVDLEEKYPKLYPFTKWERMSRENPNFILDLENIIPQNRIKHVILPAMDNLIIEAHEDEKL